MDKKSYFNIALLFNANKVYDRQIIEGIGQYLQTSNCNWNIFIEDDFRYKNEMIECLDIDGIIADFDDPDTVSKLLTLLTFSHIPTVAVGGSYKDPSYYPNIPYVATDNYALVKSAFNHLKSKGISRFAFYGIPTPKNGKHWSIERQNAFISLMEQYHYDNYMIYQGENNSSKNWLNAQHNLKYWLQQIPIHTGIIAVTDARARHLLQACESLHIAVPDQLCIIGIDNEEIISYLSRISLSSVMQGTKQIGYKAAKLLDNQLNNKPVTTKPILVPPVSVIEKTSTDYRSITDPYVIQAMHFIRYKLSRGVYVKQILDHLKISRTNLEKRFKKEMNKTIHQVIYEEKLKKAVDLLTKTSIPIKEIIHICRYPSIQYFYHIIKKEYHQTPKALRKTYKSKNTE